jgi:hypothetical protein
MLNKYVNAIQEGKFFKNSIINQSKIRQIKTIITSIVILSGVQGIEPSKVLAFDVIPLDTVSTRTTSGQYFGLGNYFETFQVEVSNKPESNPMAKLVGFTLSFTPIGFPPSPPFPQIFPEGGIDPSGDFDTSLKTPLGWQLIEMSQIPHYFCSDSFFGDPYCATILIPTLTFQSIQPIAGISPGRSLGGFGVAYNTGCGIYCVGLQRSVISVKSVYHAPEPVTILGSAIALGFGITLKRKYSKIHSNKT